MLVYQRELEFLRLMLTSVPPCGRLATFIIRNMECLVSASVLLFSYYHDSAATVVGQTLASETVSRIGVALRH